MTRKQSIWTLAIVSVALFMVTLDNLVVTNGPAVSIREDLGASLEQLEWTVNAYTLKLRGLPADRRGARRSLRPPARVRRRHSAVHAVVGRRGAGAQHRAR